MTTTTQPHPAVQRLQRLRRDPAVGLWAVAGACWAASLAVVVAGDADLADHDHVIEHSTLPWPLRIAAFMAVWVVMLGAMMLPTLVPLARQFTVVSAKAPHPRAARAVGRAEATNPIPLVIPCHRVLRAGGGLGGFGGGLQVKERLLAMEARHTD